MNLTDALLDRMRRTADPLADETVAELFRDGSVPAVNAALEQLTHNGPLPPGEGPPALLRFLEKASAAPPEVDAIRIRRAQEFFTRHGPAFGIVLMYSSLPTLYAGAQGGVQILSMTGQLSRHFRRRAAETLRFILDVMTPGGLEYRGRGIRTAQKVRLMHACIRHFARVSGRWAALPQWGEPINQEELAGTLLSFSSLAVDNLELLGGKVAPGDAEDYLHAWRCIGHWMGIEAEMRPTSMAEARDLWGRIEMRNFSRTPEGVALTRDHLDFLDEMVPGKALDGFNLPLMRHLMGRRIAVGYLGLPGPGRFSIWIDVIRRFFGFADRFLAAAGPLDRLVAEVNLQMMEALQRYWAEGRSTPFRLPQRLEEPR
jgi:hypothetical protein